MRLGFDYGITNSLSIGIGRSTFAKELDGFVKFSPLRQTTGSQMFPFSIVLISGVTMTTQTFSDPARNDVFTSRLAYYFQTIIGRKFSERFSLQLTPTLLHRNFVPLASDPNDVFAVGVGSRFKISKRVAITCDYFYVANGLQPGITHNPLSLGVDIETGGHVFQLHFSNSIGMNERAFITETTDDWSKGDIRLGFNLSRVFTVKKRKL
jgi:hypothetical protein